MVEVKNITLLPGLFFSLDRYVMFPNKNECREAWKAVLSRQRIHGLTLITERLQQTSAHCTFEIFSGAGRMPLMCTKRI